MKRERITWYGHICRKELLQNGSLCMAGPKKDEGTVENTK